MKITKHEIIVSIAIAAVMFAIGFLISGKIADYQNDKNAEYQKAVHIEDTELFLYGMETNVGNAFVYGDLESVDTVTFEEIGGSYLCVEKVEERCERHEEWVTKKDSNGKEYKEKEVWYEWETEHRESKHAEEIKFCGVAFPYGKVSMPAKEYIQTLKGNREWSWKSGEFVKVRFKYYGVSTKHTGTIYTRLADGTISDNSQFYKNQTIDKALDSCTTNLGNVMFWAAWIIFTGGSVLGFCYFENKWLED